MQVRENWADVVGKVLSVHPAESDYDAVELQIQKTEDVASAPNLFAQRVGGTVTVEVPQTSDNAHSQLQGTVVRGRLRLAGPTLAFVQGDLKVVS